jgi:hypothetical protein
MGVPAILHRRVAKPVDAIDRLIGRAARAREIAIMLSKRDADLLEAYAVECEAHAMRLMDERGVQMAA